MNRLSRIQLTLIIALLIAGCEERPETAAYREQVETLRVENHQLREQADVSAQMLNITTLGLVITGCGLGVSLFALLWTKRRNCHARL